MRTSLVAGIVSTLAAGSVLAGDAVFYGGDFDGRDGGISQNNDDIHAITYDDFTVDGLINVNEIFGNFLLTGGLDGNMTHLWWEVRQGVSEGDGGTVIISGHQSLVTDQSATGNSLNGRNEWTILMDVSAEGHTLAPGTYHLGLALAQSNLTDPPAQMGFASTTSGDNGIGSPLANGNSFLNSDFFGLNWVSWDNDDLLGPGTWDFSFGVNGTLVPAPGAIALLGLAGLAARRRRRN